MLFNRTPGVRAVFFRACVALRQVLAARKQKNVRRVTKAALAALMAWPAGGLLRAADHGPTADYSQIPSVLKVPVSQSLPAATQPQRPLDHARNAIPHMTAATPVSAKAEMRIALPPKLLPRNERYVPRSESRRQIDDPADESQSQPGTQIKPLVRLGTSIAPLTEGDLPANRAEPFFADQGRIMAVDAPNRDWLQYSYYWAATGFYHQPLYFEEVNLERYGHTSCHCLQPVLSGAHFFATIPILPYKMALDHPNECVYTLGHYRPGSCAPWQRHPCRVTPDALFVEGASVAGLILLIP